MSETLLFQLGRERRLALAELAAVVAPLGQLKDGSAQTALIQFEKEVDPPELQDRLGGVIKIGRILAKLPLTATRNELGLSLYQDLHRRPIRDFGISFIDGHWSKQDRDQLGLFVKRQVKNSGGAVRFVSGSETQLPSVLVRDQLLGRGREYLIVWTSEAIVIGETITVQAWKSWSVRDFDRPARDPRRGMLPPKLARMMINLGQFTPETTILDPFCGVGTVLQEALLLGHKHVLGSDRNELALAATKANLDWLQVHFATKIGTIRLIQSSVESLQEQQIRTEAPLGIVSEADLGPPDLVRLTPTARKERFLPLMTRYTNWLEALFGLLNQGERCVLAYPILRDPETALPVVEAAEKMGWQIQSVIPEAWLMHPATEGRRTPIVTYARPDQLVGRQIVVLKKT
ncbi:MAG: hypothetical protein AAB647_01450 [Patescibacteria group bacterium]